MVETNVGAVFYILAFFIIASAIMVVSLKNIFHCALALIMCLFSVAGIYILLNAEFLAAAQVLIYVGAVAILMIFAIMLTTNLASRKIQQVTENALVSVFICAIFCLGVVFLLWATPARIWRYATESLPVDNIAVIGKFLMTDFVLPFEVVSLLLMAAMIGAIVLARKERS